MKKRDLKLERQDTKHANVSGNSQLENLKRSHQVRMKDMSAFLQVYSPSIGRANRCGCIYHNDLNIPDTGHVWNVKFYLFTPFMQYGGYETEIYNCQGGEEGLSQHLETGCPILGILIYKGNHNILSQQLQPCIYLLKQGMMSL